MIPHIKITTEKMPANAAGMQVWFVIKLRKAFRTNQPLIAHELEHVKQWWMTTLIFAALLGALVYFIQPLWPIIALAPFMHGALYTLLRPYRRWAEVGAHRAQVRAGGDPASLAKHLSSAYKLKMTEAEAQRLIAK